MIQLKHTDNSPIDPEIKENTLIFNLNPQDQQRLNYNHELIVKSQEWDKLIANKKYVIKIILDLCNEETKADIAINLSYKKNMKTGDLIKFFMQMRKICDNAKDKNIFFGSRLSSITKHQFQPTTTVKQIIATYSMNDAIWGNTNPCDISLDNISGTEDLVNIDGTKESIATTTTLTSSVYDEIWYDTHEKCDLWYDVPEIMDGYQE